MASTPTPSTATPPSTLWKEYKNQDGRAYWFHTVDKKSVWEKPEELKTPRERAIASTKWKEYTSGDRKYYVHSETKETTWSVPGELRALFDALPGAQPPSAASPAVSTAARADSAPRATQSPAPSAPGPAPGPPPTAPSGPNGSSTPGAPPVRPPPQFANGPPGAPPGAPPARPPPTGPAAGAPYTPTGPAAASPFPPGGLQPPSGPSNAGFGPPNPVFSSPQEAFKSLLRNKGVTSRSTWEQTMRDIVTDPLYKALRSLAERKAIFNEFQSELRRQEAEERNKKKEQLKPPVIELLKSTAAQGTLKEYSSWATVLKHLKDRSELKAAMGGVGESDAKQFWEEVKKELKAAAETQQRELRHRNMDLLMSLLRTFEADTTTRWRDAHRTVIESSEWKQDAHLSSMDVCDMLIVFDEYIRNIEREESDRRKSQEKQRVRDERKRREAFRKLMAQGREEGWIHSKTAWPEVYSRLKEDERLTSMLGQRGSSPLDLFFDALDVCDRSIEGRIAAVEGLIKLGDAEWDKLDADSTWDDFMKKIRAGLDRAHKIGQGDKWLPIGKEDQELRLVYDELMAVAARAAREARKRHERHIRHLIDDARYGLKKAADDEMIAKAEGGTAFEEMATHIESLDIREWRRLDEEIRDEEEKKEVKKVTWDKFCRRQKEKAEERRVAEEEAQAAREAANARRSSRDRSADPALKRKSDANDYDDRERERARRREDRDTRRRGGRDEVDRERERDRDRDRDRDRRSTRREDEHDDRKRARYEEPTKREPTGSASAGNSGGGGENGDGDDDKEEGEV